MDEESSVCFSEETETPPSLDLYSLFQSLLLTNSVAMGSAMEVISYFIQRVDDVISKIEDVEKQVETFSEPEE